MLKPVCALRARFLLLPIKNLVRMAHPGFNILNVVALQDVKARISAPEFYTSHQISDADGASRILSLADSFTSRCKSLDAPSAQVFYSFS